MGDPPSLNTTTIVSRSETTHAMSKTRQRLAMLLGSILLVAAAYEGASGSARLIQQHPRLVREPWEQITRGRNSRTLLIDTAQDTADRSSRCFIRYTTRVVNETSHVIRIEVQEPNPEAQPFRCTANFVSGPFLVPVHLKALYRGQRLIDPVTGRPHRLTRRADLG